MLRALVGKVGWYVVGGLAVIALGAALRGALVEYGAQRQRIVELRAAVAEQRSHAERLLVEREAMQEILAQRERQRAELAQRLTRSRDELRALEEKHNAIAALADCMVPGELVDWLRAPTDSDDRESDARTSASATRTDSDPQPEWDRNRD